MRSKIWTLALLAACSPQLEQPTPALTAVSPDLVCADQKSTVVSVAGASLTPIPVDDLNDPALVLPNLSLSPSWRVDGSPGESVDLDESAGAADAVTWTSTAEMGFTVTPGRLAPGVYHLNLTHLDGQAATLSEALTVVPPPTLTAVAPEVFCDAQGDTVLALDGVGFLVADGVLPSVQVGDTVYAADAADGCVAVPGPAGAELCTQLSVTVPQGDFAAGVYDVAVTNPAPADCTSTEVVRVEILPPPVVDAVVPAAVCIDGGEVPVDLQGAGFVFFADGALPTVTIGGMDRAVLDRDGCVALSGPVSGEVCDTLSVTVPATDLGLGAHDVVVRNPAPADCVTDVPATVDVLPPPTITDVDPDAVCDSGGGFTLTGTGFTPDAQVTIDDAPAAEVQYISDTELYVVVQPGTPTGLLDVTVTTTGGCAATEVDLLEVVPAPLLFYVDPPVAYAGVSVDATLYLTGVTGDITDVWLEDADGTVIPLTFDDTNPDQIHAVLPAGLPDGDYDVNLLQDGSCPAALSQGVQVTSADDIALASIDPVFAWADGYTPVRIEADDPAPVGKVQFDDLPRVYLNPSDDPEALATALGSLSFIDPTALDAVIPPGLSPGDYDLLVVNPGGEVGFLPRALTVSPLPLPEVDALSPPSVPNSGSPVVTVQGDNFRNPRVTFDCTVPGGGSSSAEVTGTSVTATEFDVAVPVANLDGICVLTVENDDGTYVSYSSLSITNPSGNLYPFAVADARMDAPRRAPAAVTGRANSAARYLYAIGGDGGGATTARADIAVSPVDKYGELDGFFTLADALPEPRTLAGVARVDRFVYLLGGHDGETTVDPGPQSGVWRAQILDPQVAPHIEDLTVAYGDATNLGVGTWMWRVAAIYPSNHPINPGGVSLPSDPIVARLPDIPDTFEVQIGWTPVPGAVGYRIYRTPTADAGSASLVKLVDVGDVTTFTDDGHLAPTTVAPLPKGALGRWAAMPDLPGARQSPCVTTGQDPAVPERTWVYVAGGLDAGNVAHNEIHYASVTQNADGTQAMSAWSTSASRLPVAVSECGAWTVDATYHTVVGAGESWTYFGGGRTSSTTVSDVAAGRVTTTGELTGYRVSGGSSPVGGISSKPAGFGTVSASNWLYVLGGKQGGPDTFGSSSPLAAPMPDNGGFNSGISLATPRYLHGSTQESGVIFMVGGQTSSAAATDTVDWANF